MEGGFFHFLRVLRKKLRFKGTYWCSDSSLVVDLAMRLAIETKQANKPSLFGNGKEITKRAFCRILSFPIFSSSIYARELHAFCTLLEMMEAFLQSFLRLIKICSSNSDAWRMHQAFVAILTALFHSREHHWSCRFLEQLLWQRCIIYPTSLFCMPDNHFILQNSSFPISRV